MEVITKSYLKDQADAIRFELEQAAQNIVSIGQRLIEVKDALGHGEFLKWAADDLGWDKKQVNRFVQVALEFSKVTTLSLFDKSALYLLAAPSTPEAAKEEAKTLAGSGQKVTHKVAKEIVAKHKPVPVAPAVVVGPPAVSIQPTTPRSARTFDESWALLSDFQRKALNGYPGSLSAAKRLYALGQGAK